MTNILKDLIKERESAKEDYNRAQESVSPCYKKYSDAISAVENEFIKQKLYIPIDELSSYLHGKDISNIDVVYSDGSADTFFHEYDISYLTEKWDHKQNKYVPARLLSSGVSDDGYSFEEDIDKSGIIGFFNLELADGTQVKETYMDEIIQGL